MFEMEQNHAKTTKKVLSLAIALAAVAAALFLAFGIAAPAVSRTSLLGLLALTSTPRPPAGEVIPLKPVGELTSLNADVTLAVNGLINGERAQGDLFAELATNDQGSSRITVTGPLLGEIAAQVGGSLVGLFTPSSVDIYKVPEGTYIVANSLFPICVKPADSEATAALDEMSPQNLLSMLTKNEVARGRLVDQTTVNGVSVNHYVLDGEAFLAAAQKSKDAKLKAFGDALWSAGDADLYVDPKTGIPMAYANSFSGSYDPLKFEGDFDVQIEVTGINKDTEIDLPAACNKPITR
jgi:hypothetical protein